MTIVGVEPVQRLHPLSPLLHGFKALAVLVAAISVQGAYQLGWRGFIGAVVVTMCLTVAASVVSWLATGYHVVGRELRIREGVLVRRNRAIPLERLQAVEVVRPLLARLTGLAELRLEVVGGGKTEAPLAYLTVADALALHQRLLTLADRAGAATVEAAATERGEAAVGTGPAAAGTPAAAVRPEPTERHLHTVANRDVLVGQVLTPQVMFLPIAIVLVVLQYWLGGAWGFVAVASMLVAIVGVIQQPARRVMSDWNFQLAKADAGLRVHHGLTETRSQTVPLRRVQAVSVIWPLLWRAKRWLRCRLRVAGFGIEQFGTSDRLLPVGDLATARQLVAEVMPGVDLTALPLTAPPPRARWVAPLRQPILGAGLTDQVFVTRDGRITRDVTVMPYVRIQSVRMTQGPLQRALGLASVHADAAGPLTAVAHHRDLAGARRLAAELIRRAHAAREADRGKPVLPSGGDATTTS